MSHKDLQGIADHVMPSFAARSSDLGFLFGTRHGVEAFCEASYSLWRDGMFSRLLISGGRTGSSTVFEADVIAERLVSMGIPENILIVESAATNTGENVRFGRATAGVLIRRCVAIVFQSPMPRKSSGGHKLVAASHG